MPDSKEIRQKKSQRAWKSLWLLFVCACEVSCQARARRPHPLVRDVRLKGPLSGPDPGSPVRPALAPNGSANFKGLYTLSDGLSTGPPELYLPLPRL